MAISDGVILYIAGTRPEVIKIAPAVIASRQLGSNVVFMLTGQHREMAHQVLATFGIEADIDLDIMRSGATLAEITADLIAKLGEYFKTNKPAMVVVQGDTSTAAIGGLMAFYEKIPVAHVEAGLRSFDKFHPFPEEVNRKIIASYAELNFAPTRLAKENLLKENVQESQILITGNTVVDAAELIRLLLPAPTSAQTRQILVTTHRRENWNTEIEQICKALVEITNRHADVSVLLPVHRNPIVSKQIHAMLDHHTRIQLTEPLDYVSLHGALRDSYLVLTDSGGIQEEAPVYGVPTLVLRSVTERPEAVNAGVAKIIGTQTDRIVDEVERLLTDQSCYEAMAKPANPFGDGKAAQRIAQALNHHLLDAQFNLHAIGEFDYS